MEPPIHDFGVEVRSVVDMEGTDQAESNRESDDESDVYKISRGSVLYRTEEVFRCNLRLLHISIEVLNYIIFKLNG